MKLVIAILLCAVFVILSLIHFYWAFGGRNGMKQALPSEMSDDETTIFLPPPLMTAGVAVALLAIAIFILKSAGLLVIGMDSLPVRFDFYGTNILAALFFLRGVGDFRYMGLTKKVKGTVFSEWDTKLYVPLCFSISLLFVIMNYS